MKNLENLGVQEMNAVEVKEINGGFICGGLCIGAIAFVVGAAIGVAVSEVVHHHS